MITQIFTVSKWYMILTKRFIDLVATQTISIIFLTILSQIFLLLSTLMPLKVIMILASERIPRFFPEVVQKIEINTFIFYLALLTILFYALHLFFDWYIIKIAKYASSKIIKNNKKIIIFENQDIFAYNAYLKHIESLSDFVFVISSLLIIGLFYPLIPLVSIFSIIIILIFTTILYNNKKYFRILTTNYLQLIKFFHGALFLIVFIAILIDIVSNENKINRLLVIIAILLIRQVLSKLSSAIRILINSYKNRIDINSIFFYRHTRMILKTTKEDIFWKFFNYENVDKLIKNILLNTINKNILLEEFKFYHADIKNIVFLIASTSSGKYMIKIYNKTITSQAIHESLFLSEYNEVSFKLLAKTVIENCHCLIYTYNVPILYLDDKYKSNQIDMHIQIMSLTPIPKLIKQYERTHPFLYHRINKDMLNRLYNISNEDDKKNISTFENHFDFILEKLESMPKQILNPIMTKNTLLQYENKFILLHWGTWKIDTIGSYYPTNKLAQDKLAKSIPILIKNRQDFSKISENDILLSSLMTQFENTYLRENFTITFKIIKNIIEILEKIKINTNR